MSDSSDKVPRHIAIIMDGNGRWARARFLPRTAGHKQGVSVTRKIVEACSVRGVEVLTLFAFSSENWSRPEGEVTILMQLFITALRQEARRLVKNNIRLTIIGDRGRLPEKLRETIAGVEEATRHCTGMRLQVAANYGGRLDLRLAMRAIAEKVAAGKLNPAAITEALIADHLATAGLPDPDLFIRTGGETRISNFLLWQLAYTELWFTDLLWPDFDAEALDAAIAHFSARERRFGKTGEQLVEDA